MRSYASIDRIEGLFAVCELELVPVEESANFTPFEKETEMVDLRVESITEVCGEVEEGDIIILEHDDDVNLITVCEKDDAEKQRRIKLLEEIMNS